MVSVESLESAVVETVHYLLDCVCEMKNDAEEEKKTESTVIPIERDGISDMEAADITGYLVVFSTPTK